MGPVLTTIVYNNLWTEKWKSLWKKKKFFNAHLLQVGPVCGDNNDNPFSLGLQTRLLLRTT